MDNAGEISRRMSEVLDMSQDQIDTVDRMVRNSVTEEMEYKKRQAENMKRVDPFEHIR